MTNTQDVVNATELDAMLKRTLEAARKCIAESVGDKGGILGKLEHAIISLDKGALGDCISSAQKGGWSECLQTYGLPHSLLGNGVLKPLEWKESWSGHNDDIPVWKAENPLGLFISISFAGRHNYEKHCEANPDELAVLKAEAEASYQKQVLSAFSLAPLFYQPPYMDAPFGFVQEEADHHLNVSGAASVRQHVDLELGYTVPVYRQSSNAHKVWIVQCFDSKNEGHSFVFTREHEFKEFLGYRTKLYQITKIEERLATNSVEAYDSMIGKGSHD